jgi:hypothetical protein
MRSQDETGWSKVCSVSNIFGLDWKDVGVFRRSKRSGLASPLPRKNTVDGQNPVPVGTVTIGNYETQ